MSQESILSLQDRAFFRRSDLPVGFFEKAQSVGQWKWLADRFDEFENRPAAISTTCIPKIIHQIWIGSRLPLSYRGWTNSWKRLNEGWEYRLWDSKEIIALGLKNEEAFRPSRSVGARSDIARYEILERFGGVYADTDFECLRPVQEIAARCSFFVALIFAITPVISNGLIGTRAGHPLLQEAIRGLGSAGTDKGRHGNPESHWTRLLVQTLVRAPGSSWRLRHHLSEQLFLPGAQFRGQERARRGKEGDDPRVVPGRSSFGRLPGSRLRAGNAFG